MNLASSLPEVSCFSCSLAHPDWPLNSSQLHLASAESEGCTHLGNVAPRPKTQRQPSTDCVPPMALRARTGQGCLAAVQEAPAGSGEAPRR